MAEKYRSKLAVNLVLTRDNNGIREILLQLRQNTGYMDGTYDFASSGHVEQGESYKMALVREAKEEIGITIKEEDLNFLAINHNYRYDYVQVFFSASSYEGEPVICESDQCGELLWVDINNLPSNTMPYVANVINDILCGIPYDDGDFTVLKRHRG